MLLTTTGCWLALEPGDDIVVGPVSLMGSGAGVGRCWLALVADDDSVVGPVSLRGSGVGVGLE